MGWGLLSKSFFIFLIFEGFGCSQVQWAKSKQLLKGDELTETELMWISWSQEIWMLCIRPRQTPPGIMYSIRCGQFCLRSWRKKTGTQDGRPGAGVWESWKYTATGENRRDKESSDQRVGWLTAFHWMEELSTFRGKKKWVTWSRASCRLQ